MKEIKLTKRGKAVVKNAKKNQKSEKRNWDYAEYCKKYAKKMNTHKKIQNFSVFFSKVSTATVSTVKKTFFSLFNRAKGKNKIFPAA